MLGIPWWSLSALAFSACWLTAVFWIQSRRLKRCSWLKKTSEAFLDVGLKRDSESAGFYFLVEQKLSIGFRTDCLAAVVVRSCFALKLLKLLAVPCSAAEIDLASASTSQSSDESVL